ncbi:MAG TPA: biotin transporter BioY [Oscillospiraceae bacterium]|nr:biotin transporter BioY [Oscillospiraceae bacterium]HPS35686.1 biotin transporter BioY [Oscillospiraceae bacterium]
MILPRTKLGKVILCGLFAAILCILAIITIPIGQVPITMALLGVFMTAAILPPFSATASVLVYILIGAIGIPVYSGFGAGVGVLLGATGGYLMAYPVMALAVSGFLKLFKNRWYGYWLGAVAALLLCYGFGTLWFCKVTGTGFTAALAVCVFPFIPFDIVKAAAAFGVKAALIKTIK